MSQVPRGTSMTFYEFVSARKVRARKCGKNISAAIIVGHSKDIDETLMRTGVSDHLYHLQKKKNDIFA